jgi:hypothetical protein
VEFVFSLAPRAGTENKRVGTLPGKEEKDTTNYLPTCSAGAGRHEFNRISRIEEAWF